MLHVTFDTPDNYCACMAKLILVIPYSNDEIYILCSIFHQCVRFIVSKKDVLIGHAVKGMRKYSS